jgi:hypothetical protein
MRGVIPALDLSFFSPKSPINCASQDDPTYPPQTFLHSFMAIHSMSTELKASSSSSHIELNELIIF